MQARLTPGRSTRADVLELLGPPTGYFDTNLLASITPFVTPLSASRVPVRVDDEVFTYQEVSITGRALFFPLLFIWGDARITSRTLIVFFDPDGVVRYSGYREDRS